MAIKANGITFNEFFEEWLKRKEEELKQEPEPYIAYKGFDKDLKCNNGTYQYEIGKIYDTGHTGIPKTCTNQGFHYCDNLSETFSWYPLGAGNRYCQIEVLGQFSGENGKKCSTKIKILKEINKDEIEKAVEDRIVAEVESNLGLSLVKKIQTAYPTIHVGGSVGLFLHGIRLKRWSEYGGDVDVVSPYFQVIQPIEDGDKVSENENKRSGNDFDISISYNDKTTGSRTIDIKIDPHQHYKVIEYKGFTYKVSLLETILGAKLKYSQCGNQKHKDDIIEMLNLKK